MKGQLSPEKQINQFNQKKIHEYIRAILLYEEELIILYSKKLLHFFCKKNEFLLQ